ncbi:hypothetical protein [Antrihabitans cavernicola]|nr:hypothetical protein [Spelaeibacter cavernicola]
MFDGGFIPRDLTTDLPLFEALSSVVVRENVCAFEKVTIAAELWDV